MAKLGVQFLEAMAVALLVAASLTGEAEAGILSGESGVGWLPGRPACDGTIGGCLGGEDEEMGMDSEINRRILQTSNRISYDALKADIIPCSRAGASYYNCRPGAAANPYKRGCSVITGCARS